MTRAEESQRFYQSLCDVLERRINIIIGRATGDWPRYVGRVYDPTYDFRESGGGRTCSRCRRVARYDVRVCPSCGTIAP